MPYVGDYGAGEVAATWTPDARCRERKQVGQGGAHFKHKHRIRKSGHDDGEGKGDACRRRCQSRRRHHTRVL